MKYDDGITHTHEIINDDSMYRLHLYVDYHSKHLQIFSLRPSVKTLSASILIRRLVEVVVVFSVCVYTSLSCPSFCVCVCCSCVPFCFFHSICSLPHPSVVCRLCSMYSGQCTMGRVSRRVKRPWLDGRMPPSEPKIGWSARFESADYRLWVPYWTIRHLADAKAKADEWIVTAARGGGARNRTWARSCTHGSHTHAAPPPSHPLPTQKRRRMRIIITSNS
jgi:hypothetical protein